MPIKVKILLSDLDWGSILYIKADPDQYPYVLRGVVTLPNNLQQFVLQYFDDSEPVYMYDYECSVERAETEN